MRRLQVDELRIRFGEGPCVVDGISFCIAEGEILALVGGSGSGKSLTARALLGLLPATARCSGRVRLDDIELSGWTEKQWRTIRGRDIALIFQDPMATLNPVLRIDTQLMEAVHAHRRLPYAQTRELALRTLEQVGLPEASRHLHAYPHQLSGGMRQRVAIAMALINHPAFIIADEATTALDVTLQAQVLQLLRAHCREQGSGLLWISHDLALVAGLADRIAVMHEGLIVETGPTARIVHAPTHPYTRALLAAVPWAARGARR